MPKASDELRAKWGGAFDYGPEKAMKFLREAGYRLHHSEYAWSKPGVKSFGDMSRDEFEAMMFLVHEWDFGDLKCEAA